MAVALIICIAFMLPVEGRSALRFLKKYMELSYNSKLESENEKIKNFEGTLGRG
jgi:hypothetical protein